MSQKLLKFLDFHWYVDFIQNPRSKVLANNAYASWFYLGISPQTPL